MCHGFLRACDSAERDRGRGTPAILTGCAFFVAQTLRASAQGKVSAADENGVMSNTHGTPGKRVAQRCA